MNGGFCGGEGGLERVVAAGSQGEASVEIRHHLSRPGASRRTPRTTDTGPPGRRGVALAPARARPSSLSVFIIPNLTISNLSYRPAGGDQTSVIEFKSKDFVFFGKARSSIF